MAINRPAQQNLMARDLGLVGSIAGGIIGGIGGKSPGAVAGGAAAGAVTGHAAGNLVGGMAGPSQSEAPAVGGGERASTALSRRLESQASATQALAAADSALQKAPPEYQQQYGPVIKRARYLNTMETA